MALINPHMNFNGNAEEAFTFYKSVFGGEFAKIIRFKDLSSPEFPVAESEANKIMHIALPIGKNLLMANDVPESMGKTNENENRSNHEPVDNNVYNHGQEAIPIANNNEKLSLQNIDEGLLQHLVQTVRQEVTQNLRQETNYYH